MKGPKRLYTLPVYTGRGVIALGNKGPKYRGITRDTRSIVYSDQIGLAEFFKKVEDGIIKDYTVEEIKKAYENNYNLYKKIDELEKRIEALEGRNPKCPNCNSIMINDVNEEGVTSSTQCNDCGLVMTYKS